MLKILKYNTKNSFKNLEKFLDKRKSIQRNQSSSVMKKNFQR